MSTTITVVVAEDEAIIRMDLVEVLREEGYDVVAECGRGDDAIRLVGEHRPDLALLDVKMPGMTGIDAARAITAETDTAVVILTAFSQRELIHDQPTEELLQSAHVLNVERKCQQLRMIGNRDKSYQLG